MDLRCSLLGHDFAPSELERRRDAHDAEEVVSVREFRECRRCGTRELLSENTHIRARADGGEETDDDDDAEVLEGDLDGSRGDDRSPPTERDDDIIEAPSEEPDPEVPESVDLSAFEADREDPEASDPGDIVEAPSDDAPADSEPDDAAPPSEPEAVVFACPDCGLEERPGRTSLRPGDICPRCREDYLVERPS
ncbi:MAG: DUF7093 family protein [Halobacteriota archaeon]